MHVASRAWRYLDIEATNLVEAVEQDNWHHVIATIDALGGVLIPPDHEDGSFLVLFEEKPADDVRIRLYLTLGNLISRTRMIN